MDIQERNTLKDGMHHLAIHFFAKWDSNGINTVNIREDELCLTVFPILYYKWVSLLVY